MKMAFIRSISGLRSTIDEENLFEKLSLYVKSFSEIIQEGAVAVGRDGRPSGEQIESVVIDALTSCGREVKLLGIVPTPTVQFIVEKMNCAGGIAITASHNPKEWNGLKFINDSGVFFDAGENTELWKIVDNNKISDKFKDNYQNITHVKDALELHVNSILALPFFKDSNILELIRKRNFKVVVDAVNSSGSLAVPMLLEKLNCEIFPLFCDGSGIFPHTPEPLPENLTQLADKVKEMKFDIGIAVDPDADRLVMIDENGEPIGEEKTIVTAIHSVLDSYEFFWNKFNKTAVVNHSTTRVSDDVAAMFDAVVLRSPVGEINVVKKMKMENAVVGGEGSGGVILPECHYGRDSLVGISLVLALLAKKNLTLSELVATYPKYEMQKTKFNFTGSLTTLIPVIKERFRDYTILEDDGIKLIKNKEWVQLRSSNTEPIIRIIAEAETKEKSQNLINSVKELLPLP